MDENTETTLTTAEDFKEFFLQKFATSMKDLVSFLLGEISEENSTYSKLTKINNILNNKNIDYQRLVNKLCNNEKIIMNLTILKESNINETVLDELLKKGSQKDWVLIPEFHVDKIIREIDNKQTINKIIDDIKNIFVCAESYNGIDKMISEHNTDGTDEEFDPTKNLIASNNLSDINVNTMFKDVKYKQMTSYEMLIKMMVDEKTENKVGEYMNNIKEDDVNEAASKLDDVLKGSEANSNASKLLGTMLSNIKDEVIDLGNQKNSQVEGKEAMENLMNIAKKVAGNMATDVQSSGLTPMEIWEATSSLARKTVKSDALDIVDGIIKQNIYNGMNNDQQQTESNNDLQNKLKMLNFDDEND